MNEQLFLVGYQQGQQTRLGLMRDSAAYTLDPKLIPSFEWLLQNTAASEIVERLNAAVSDPLPADSRLTLNGVLTHQPVWAAGVTYKTSEEARERESQSSTIYTRVYNAERPEVFWKSVGYEVVSHQDEVGIRYDASWSVPEPELTVVFNARMEVIGFTIGNDMSSRDIEGANPLYLPQAKVYDAACSLGSRIWLQPNADTWPQATIQIEILRDGAAVFSSSTTTERLHRTLPELGDYLGRCKHFPYGVLLMTGTGIVPPDTFTLREGDVIRIQIPPIGELVNQVRLVSAAHT